MGGRARQKNRKQIEIAINTGQLLDTKLSYAIQKSCKFIGSSRKYIENIC